MQLQAAIQQERGAVQKACSETGEYKPNRAVLVVYRRRCVVVEQLTLTWLTDLAQSQQNCWEIPDPRRLTAT